MRVTLGRKRAACFALGIFTEDGMVAGMRLGTNKGKQKEHWEQLKEMSGLLKTHPRRSVEELLGGEALC